MLQISLAAFADKMNEIMPVIAKEFARHQRNELYKGKITFAQFLILEFLHRTGESKMKELAKFMHVTTAAMTGIVDRIVRDGYAQRINDSRDRRIINIRLTRKGSGLVKKIDGQRRKTVIDIFGKISERDRQEYLRILMQIKDVLIKGKEA